ncbi:MAG TPA: CHAT domain-containing protein [Planctomycetota bacterium]
MAALARLNLVSILLESGDLARARTLAEQGLEALATLPERNPELQTARESLSAVVSQQGDIDGALALHEQVLAARLRILADEHEEVQTTRGNLARTIAAKARVLLDQGQGRTAIAELERRHGELVAAMARGLQRQVQLAILSNSSRGAEEICANLGEPFDRLLSLVAGYDVFASDPALERAAFATLETSRGAALTSKWSQYVAQHDARYAACRQRIAAANLELARIAQGSGDPEQVGATVARRDQAEQELTELASTAGASNSTMDLDALAARLAPGEAVVAWRSYQRRTLPPGAIHDTMTESLCAFVLRAGGKLQRFELGSLAAIEKAAHDWRTLLGAPAPANGGHAGLDRGRPGASAADRSQLLQSAGDQLRQLILDPLMPAIREAGQLVLLPDAVLHAVPIDALPLARPATAAGATAPTATPRLCGEQWTMRVQLSLRAPAQSVPRTATPLLLALGSAAFDSEPLAHDADEDKAADPQPTAGAAILRGSPWEHGFGPLPGSAIEAHELAALAQEAFSGSVHPLVLDERKASRESVVHWAPQARWLHLATHGWFAPESIRSWESSRPAKLLCGAVDSAQRIRGMSPMLLCGLAFAGANLPADATGRYRGLITAEEIAGWDLSGCELAVLSACDTNVGDRRAGQGVASLQKALHMAGARTVVTSLWKVPDQATKDLMLDFYRRLWVEKKPTHQALWEAKMRLRNAVDAQGKPLYAPRDWAGWVLTGAK